MNVAGQKSPEDSTQSGKSGECSPEISLSSKLRHLEIRKAEEEAEENKGKKEEKAKETVVKLNQTRSIPEISFRHFLHILTPLVRASLPTEKFEFIDKLICQRGSKRADQLIESRRLNNLVRNISWGVEESARSSYKTIGITQFFVSALLVNTKNFLQQLGFDNMVEGWSFLEDGSKTEHNKMYDYERLVSTFEQVLRDV